MGSRVDDDPLVASDKALEVIERLEAGDYIEVACKAAGISSRSVRRWMNRGRYEHSKRQAGSKGNRDLDPYVEFYVEASKAQARAEGRAVDAILKADDWRAKGFYLERKFPKRQGS